MEDWQKRTALLIGEAPLKKLADSHVLVVGLGGVGAYAAEMLCRAGVGEMTIVDGDTFNETNLNRQLPALTSTMGQNKASAMATRLQDINPSIKLHVINEFIRDERTIEILNSRSYNFVVDAIDTLSPKVFLIYHSITKGLPIISSMGSGGKMDPSQIKITDISKTEYCHLARMVRKRLHKLGINKGLPVVFSTEQTTESAIERESEEENKNSTIGTISYMPAIFGCTMASHVIKELIKRNDTN